jgi:hypothetical protein
MSIYDYLKSAATNFISPPKKPMANPENPGYNNPTYKDLNKDGVDPLLKPKRNVNLLNPAKDANRDISKDKHGHYVTTMTYPLPPLSWQKQQYDKNRKMRNSGNKFL